MLYTLSYVWLCGYRNLLHKYVNEDVSLGSWFLGLDVEHVDDRRLCCGTTGKNKNSNGLLSIFFKLIEWDTADCEWKAQAGNMCVASFDWSCSGICRSADRMKDVHRRCGEGPNALMAASFWKKDNRRNTLREEEYRVDESAQHCSSIETPSIYV